MSFSAEYVYRILDKYSGPLNQITRATEKFKDRARKASVATKRLSKRMENAGQSMANFRSMIGGAAITAGMFKFAKGASVMEDAMADVGRVTGLGGKALDSMQEKLQRMGRETGRSAEGLAAIAYEGGKLGIANDQMLGFVMTVTKTAAAFDMADSEAGRAMGSIRAKLGLTVAGVDTLMQRVNFLADNTSASGNQMIEIIERTSGTFKTLNIPAEVSAGWAAFANQVEVTPELAASGLNMMMSRMMKMPGMLEKMLKDPKKAVVNFLKRFEDMPEARRGKAILKVFGDEAGRFVLKAVANTKLLDDAMGMAASNKALGSMDREFANILARSSTAGKRVKETFIDIARTIGSVFLKVFDKYSARLIKVSDHILEFVKAHPGLVKIAGAVGLILAAVVAIAVPVGLLFSIIAGGLPIMSALLAVVGGISLPVVALVFGIIALISAVGMVYNRSEKFRKSLSNLVEAFRPLTDGIKMAVFWVLSKLSPAFSDTFSGMSVDVKGWGDLFAGTINIIADLIRGLFNMIGNLGEAMGALSMGEFGDAWEAVKRGFDSAEGDTPYFKGVGMEASSLKAAHEVYQNNKVEVTGGIDVTASGGAQVKRAEINLNTGYNLAASH